MLSLVDAWIKAAIEHKTLRIRYYSARTKSEVTVREVEPDYYGWGKNRRNFGLWGFCRLRKQVRCFKEDSIHGWEYVGNDFKPSPYARFKELESIYKTKRLKEIEWE